MKPFAIFFLFLLACLVAGALLAYPVVLTDLVHAPPHRIATRLTQVFILVGFWPFLRWLQLDTRTAIGLGTHWSAFRQTLGLGWLGGVCILLVLSLTLFVLGVRIPDPGAFRLNTRLLETALQGLAAGLLIATIEEIFFRGALFTAIRRQGSAAEALVWSSLLYALLHFLKPHALDASQPLDWSLSWALFAGTFTDFSGWDQLGSLLALFLAGMLLAAIREHTGHVGYCVGIHAGWVFVIKLTRHLTDGNDASPYAFLAGDYDGVTGYLAALWLSLLLAIGWIALRRRNRRAAQAADPN